MGGGGGAPASWAIPKEGVNRGDVALPMLVVVVVVVWMCVEKFCLVAHVPKHQLWKLTRSYWRKSL